MCSHLLPVSFQNSEQEEEELFVLFTIVHWLGATFTYLVLSLSNEHPVGLIIRAPCCPSQSGTILSGHR